MVYLVLRSEYELPHGRRLIPFEACPDLLAWFTLFWETDEGDSALHEFDFRGMWNLLDLMNGKPAPSTHEELKAFIDSIEHFGEGWISMDHSSVTAFSDDDEIEFSWYLFDSSFVAQFPERTAFLLHPELSLPTTFAAPGEKPWRPMNGVRTLPETTPTNRAAGMAYACLFSAVDGMTIMEIDGCWAIPSELDELGQWLGAQPLSKETSREWPEVFCLLRACALLHGSTTMSQLLRDFDQLDQDVPGCWVPSEFSSFRYKSRKKRALFSDVKVVKKDVEDLVQHQPEIHNHDRWSKGETFFQTSPHMNQAVFKSIHDGVSFVRQWVFFDHHWAAEHPSLAEGILRFGSDDILS